MPWKDKAKVRAYQRRWHAKKKQDKEWFSRKCAQKKKRNKEFRTTPLYLVERARQLEHRWRLREWEHAHRSERDKQITRGSGLRIVNASRDKNPIFTVISGDGRKKKEVLFEPFPVW